MAEPSGPHAQAGIDLAGMRVAVRGTSGRHLEERVKADSPMMGDCNHSVEGTVEVKGDRIAGKGSAADGRPARDSRCRKTAVDGGGAFV